MRSDSSNGVLVEPTDADDLRVAPKGISWDGSPCKWLETEDTAPTPPAKILRPVPL